MTRQRLTAAAGYTIILALIVLSLALCVRLVTA